LQETANQGQDWATRIESGDPAAEAELVAHYQRAVSLVLLRRTGKPHLAKDLSQDTFVVVLRRLRAGELNNPNALSTFIRQTAVNISIDHFRREQRYVSQEDDVIALHSAHEDRRAQEIDNATTRAMLDEALAQLSISRDRDILRRFYLQDEDKDSICRDLGLSAAHFDRVLYRAKQRMRQLIKQQAGLKALLFEGLTDG
jgi:RNA polymerase sigma-70 factor (ECF subfamily)